MLVVKKRLLCNAVPGTVGGGTVFFVTDKDHRYLRCDSYAFGILALVEPGKSASQSSIVAVDVARGSRIYFSFASVLKKQ